MAASLLALGGAGPLWQQSGGLRRYPRVTASVPHNVAAVAMRFGGGVPAAWGLPLTETFTSFVNLLSVRSSEDGPFMIL